LLDVQHILGCQITQFPIRYLGLPLSTTKIPKAAIQSTVDAVARRLPTYHGPLMARSGRLVWIKLVLSAVPIYSMIADGLPPWATAEIDSICRRFLWAGKDGAIRGKCMVAWQTCTRPTELNGLGIIDLRLAGTAFQTKWLWLQRTKQDRAWSELPIKSSPEALAFFRASTYTVVGDGKNTLFWTDNWINGESIQDIALALLPFVFAKGHSDTDDGASVAQWELDTADM
jgi:hypothetical protein